MRIVGLTGGIASGKSTVSNLFKVHGVPVVDPGHFARDVLKKGTAGWKDVVAAFGKDILLDNGDIDKAKLRDIVFSDPDKNQLLKRLLLPYRASGIIWEILMLWEILKLWMKGYKVIVLEIPLLFEARLDKWTNAIIVVCIDPETQLQRLIARDKISVVEARNRIQAQVPLRLVKIKAGMPLCWKIKVAIIIDNTGLREKLNKRFQRVLSRISKPFNWVEFVLSRQGAFVASMLLFLVVIICRKTCN